MDRDLKLRGTILHKLDRKGKWGPVHTSLDNLPKGLPSDLRGEAKAVARALIKEGLILEKPTFYPTFRVLNSEILNFPCKYPQHFLIIASKAL